MSDAITNLLGEAERERDRWEAELRQLEEVGEDIPAIKRAENWLRHWLGVVEELEDEAASEESRYWAGERWRRVL